jgi:WD40 repeat protein
MPFTPFSSSLPMKKASAARFFVTGGTLKPDAASYIRRIADVTLCDNLVEGEFCYVLNARQMGKSSLMVNTAARLAAKDIVTVLLDLTAVGQNVTLEQWYYGVLARIAEQLSLQGELDRFWNSKSALAPQQRWILALTEVFLRGVQGPLVIFVDEIDVVRSLPFRTDEFFAGIREIYNRRSADANIRRLTFCLLGVATPAELIQDPDTTPFNIGARVPLSDFTFEEAQHLSQGLNHGRDGYSLLKRVFYWTDGHPYLTQRLCRAIAEDDQIIRAADVDEACKRIFFSHEGRDRDDNLLFVRDRLLQDSDGVAAVLQLYLLILRRSPKAETLPQGPLADLVLSGAVKIQKRVVKVRNRLYAHAFDHRWVSEKLPGGEQRRLRRSFWKGVARASTAAAGIGAALMGLTVFALNEKGEADRNAANYAQLAYESDIGLAQRYLDATPPDGEAAAALLEEAGKLGNGKWNSWEWMYLWQRAHEYRVIAQLPPLKRAITPRFAFLDRDHIACGRDQELSVLSTSSGEKGPQLLLPFAIRALASDGKTVAASGLDKVAFFSSDLTPAGQLPLPSGLKCFDMKFSKDGNFLLCSCQKTETQWELLVYSLEKRTAAPTRILVPDQVDSIDLDGAGEIGLVTTAGLSGSPALYLLNLRQQEPKLRPLVSGQFPLVACFGGSSKTLYAANNEGTFSAIDRATGATTYSEDLPGLTNAKCICFSPTSNSVSVMSHEGTLVSVDIANRMRTRTHVTPTFITNPQMASSPDGSIIAWSSAAFSPYIAAVPYKEAGVTFQSVTDNGTVRAVKTQKFISSYTRYGVQVATAAQEPDAVSSRSGILSWASSAEAQVRGQGAWIRSNGGSERVLEGDGPQWHVMLSPNGQRVLTIAADGSAGVYECSNFQRIAKFDRVLDACFLDNKRVAILQDDLPLRASAPGEPHNCAANGLVVWEDNGRLVHVDGLTQLLCPQLTPDHRQLCIVSAGKAAEIHFLDCRTLQPRYTVTLQSGLSIKQCILINDRTLAAAMSNQHVMFFSAISGKVLLDLAPALAARSALTSLAMSRDGLTLAIGTSDGKMIEWSVPSP